MKKQLADFIDGIGKELIELSDYIHDNPELGHEEVKASNALTSYLSKHGFEVEMPFSQMKTAFCARRQLGKGGKKIGLLCEYDALEGLGHGCAHNIQGPVMIGVALSLVNVLGDEVDAEILVYGTPAEETDSAKIPMVKNGVFDDLDVALMVHGGDRTTVDTKSMALTLMNFIYTGTPSHAAVSPEKGRSALDGVIHLFNGIEYLREHVSSSVRMHGIIKEGGVAANIVPQRAVAQYYIRAYTRNELNEVIKRVEDVAQGSALMTGTKVIMEEVKSYDNKINVQSLNDVLFKNAHEFNLPNITPPREKTGSTDFSSVTYRIPGSCLRTSFIDLGVPNHTTQWVDASKSPRAHEAILNAAKVIASSCYDILSDEKLMNEIKLEFANNKKKLS